MSAFDIEDGFDAKPTPKSDDSDVVLSKVRSRKLNAKEESKIESEVGWNKQIYVRTWGCAHNSSDSEYMSGLLSKAGYSLTQTAEEADLWLLNSCTVKTPSETQFRNTISKALDSGKKVVVGGCVSQAAPDVDFLKNVSIVGVQQIEQVVHVVEETLKGNTVRFLSQRRKTNLSLDMPKVRKNKYVEILAINQGCLNHCTYCKTKMARGDLKSFEKAAIVTRAENAFAEGCKEVWLTSEDLGAYGRDIGLTLPDLLDDLVKIIPDGCMMRLGMTNPPYILDHLEDIARILNHPRVYSFLHIPVQSGSDAVLNDMKREYTSANFCHVVDFMIKHVPNIYIATDFICAFPTEDVEDFEESINLLRKYRFPSVFINQFYPRPGTAAARLKKIDTVEARRRTALMTTAFHSYSRYTCDRVGEIHDVLICETASDGIHYVGHNKSYEQILVPSVSNKHLMGSRVRVKITEVSKFHMKSIVMDSATKRRNVTSKVLLFIVVMLLHLLPVGYYLLLGRRSSLLQ